MYSPSNQGLEYPPYEDMVTSIGPLNPPDWLLGSGPNWLPWDSLYKVIGILTFLLWLHEQLYVWISAVFVCFNTFGILNKPHYTLFFRFRLMAYQIVFWIVIPSYFGSIIFYLNSTVSMIFNWLTIMKLYIRHCIFIRLW